MQPYRPIDFDSPVPKTLPVALQHLTVSFIAAGLTLACAGCSLFGAKPAPAPPPTAQQLQAYAQQQAELRNDASRPQIEHCDELAAATPGVEELRLNQGNVESRQWTLIANGADWRWVFVRTTDGSPEGWAPKPGIDKLKFEPPLESSLSAHASVFLAYASVDPKDPAESPRSAALRDTFGVPQGGFTWRGRRYAYTLTPELPCFPRLQ